MTISSTTTQTLTPCNGTTTNFAFANKIFSASDLVATLIDLSGNLYAFLPSGTNTFTNATTGLSYTVFNIDVDGGCFIVFSAAPTNGWSLDLRTAIAELQSTSIKNQSSFLPELHEEAFDRFTRELQDLCRLTYTFGIHGPDIESTPWPSVGSPSVRVNTNLGFGPLGQLQTSSALASGTLSQATICAFLSGTAFSAGPNAAAPIVMTQNYNYSGGTAGFVVPVLNLVANVTNCGNNFAWTFLSQMNNSSTGTSQNVAAFFQGTAVVTSASPTFAAVFEGRDLSGSANPTTGRVSVEIDRRDNGTDTGANRVALDVVITRPLVGGAFTGAAMTASYGIRVGSSTDAANVTIGSAFTVFSTNVGYAFDCANAVTIAGALRMANTVPILFDIIGGATGTENSLSGTTGSGLDHKVQGVLTNRLLKTGGIYMVGASHTVVINAATSTGANTPSFANCPGAGATTWINTTIDGVQFWQPAVHA